MDTDLLPRDKDSKPKFESTKEQKLRIKAARTVFNPKSVKKHT